MESNTPSSSGCGGGSCGCHGAPESGQGDATRRNLLKAAGVTLGAAAFAKALAPLATWSRDNLSVEDFLQQHYRELDKEQLARVLQHIEEDTKKNYGAEVTVKDHRPQLQVKFGYALNLSICIG